MKQRSYYDSIDLFLTLNCNLGCYCCAKNSPLINEVGKFFYDFELLKKDLQFILNLENIDNLKYLNIFGGEPTIHPQFEEICEFAYNEIHKRNLKIDIIVYSNGLKFSKLKNVVQFVDKIFVSDYGLKGVNELVENDTSGKIFFSELDVILRKNRGETVAKHDTKHDWCQYQYDFKRYDIFNPKFNDCRNINIFNSEMCFFGQLFSLRILFPQHSDKFKFYDLHSYKSYSDILKDMVKFDKFVNIVDVKAITWSKQKTKITDIIKYV